MSAALAFDVLAECGRARRGRIRTPHGDVDTPAFMPVGTRATVKSLTPTHVRETGTQIILANTYHLMLRPGAEVIAALGGLQRITGWHGPMLTDSGGFQVFSLADLRTVTDKGVTFRSHIDGALVHLTPEESIRVQNLLGADIIMAFDECPPLGEKQSDQSKTLADTARPTGDTSGPADQARRPANNAGCPADGFSHRPGSGEADVARAVERTIRWAARSKAAHARADQALYGIVQGGLDLALRRRCLSELAGIGFDGYALGGLSVGEPPAQMHALLQEFAHELPADQPRYLMGVGTPLDLVVAVAAGLDQFDCVLPTRNGRKGYAFTSAGVIRLNNAAHRTSTAPVDPACGCYCCANFSRGYLRHLFQSGETLGGTLLSLHNVTFYQDLMRQMRAALSAGTFEAWRHAFEQGPLGRTACSVEERSTAPPCSNAEPYSNAKPRSNAQTHSNPQPHSNASACPDAQPRANVKGE